jgi:hypothetical protein
MLAFIERLRDRRATQRQTEIVLAANLAIREIKRRTIRQILHTERRTPVIAHDNVVDSTAIEVNSLHVEPS